MTAHRPVGAQVEAAKDYLRGNGFADVQEVSGDDSDVCLLRMTDAGVARALKLGLGLVAG